MLTQEVDNQSDFTEHPTAMAMTAGDATLKAIRDTNKISALLNGAKVFKS